MIVECLYKQEEEKEPEIEDKVSFVHQTISFFSLVSIFHLSVILFILRYSYSSVLQITFSDVNDKIEGYVPLFRRSIQSTRIR